MNTDSERTLVDGMRPCCASKPGHQHRSYCEQFTEPTGVAKSDRCPVCNGITNPTFPAEQRCRCDNDSSTPASEVIAAEHALALTEASVPYSYGEKVYVGSCACGEWESQKYVESYVEELHAEHVVEARADEVATLRAELDEWKREADARARHTADAWAEVERMRPVVEACESWVDNSRDVKDGNSFKAMHVAFDAVDEYRGISHDA